MDRPQPVVSVIIPVFNRAGRVVRALESVFDQKMEQVEVIVVDDGSTDDLKSSLRELPGEIELIHQPNRGAGAARNAGIDLAHGRYIAFLDSDDRWFPGKLASQVAFLEAHPDIHWSACAYDASSDDPETADIGSRRRVSIEDLGVVENWFEAYETSILTTTSGVLVRSAALNEVGGFDEKARSGHDYDLWFRLAIRYPRLAYCWAPAFMYTLHSADSLTASAPRLYEQKLDLLSKHVGWEVERAGGDARRRRVIEQSEKFIRRSLHLGRRDLALAMANEIGPLVPARRILGWRLAAMSPGWLVQGTYRVLRKFRTTTGRSTRLTPSNMSASNNSPARAKSD